MKGFTDEQALRVLALRDEGISVSQIAARLAEETGLDIKKGKVSGFLHRLDRDVKAAE